MMGTRVIINPNVCGGYAYVRGTRIPAWSIYAAIRVCGTTTRKILKMFPELSPVDVVDVLEYGDKHKNMMNAQMQNSDPPYNIPRRIFKDHTPVHAIKEIS